MRPILVLLLALVLYPPLAPPTVEWTLDNTRLIITWEQGVSEQRCFTLESPSHPPVDYGCVWAFQGAEKAVLPLRGGPVAPIAQPEPGDTIVMDDLRLLVPARPVRWFFPVAAAP